MVLKLTLLILAVLISYIQGAPVDSTFSNAAGGWLKYYKNADYSDAEAHCAMEGGVLASPVTSQIRDAISSFVKQESQCGTWIMTGVRADARKGDFFSGEGVLLSKMPVIYNFDISGNSNECIMWRTGSTEVQSVDCNTKLDYVCFKKRDTVNVVGCGTRDLNYKYDARSGSCYKVHNDVMSWSGAFQKCKAEGAALAVINNELERHVLKEISALTDEFSWVGIRDWKEDGKSWVTVQGQQTLSEAGFEVWSPGYPLGNTLHCVSIDRSCAYDNISCDQSRPFICEKKPEILTRTIL